MLGNDLPSQDSSRCNSGQLIQLPKTQVDIVWAVDLASQDSSRYSVRQLI